MSIENQIVSSEKQSKVVQGIDLIADTKALLRRVAERVEQTGLSVKQLGLTSVAMLALSAPVFADSTKQNQVTNPQTLEQSAENGEKSFSFELSGLQMNLVKKGDTLSIKSFDNDMKDSTNYEIEHDVAEYLKNNRFYKIKGMVNPTTKAFECKVSEMEKLQLAIKASVNKKMQETGWNESKTLAMMGKDFFSNNGSNMNTLLQAFRLLQLQK
jgi:hypothetical protein